MKILLADKLHPESVASLQSLEGTEVVNQPSLGAEDLPQALSQVDVLVVRSTKVTAQACQSGENLGLIIRAGSGYNNVDVETASNRGVYVANCPGKNSTAVAELAVGLMLALDRRIADNVEDARKGQWNKGLYGKSRGFQGRTVGLIGTGAIGMETAARLRPFGVRLRAWSRSLTPEKAEVLGLEFCASPLELAASCDIVSLHLALSKETRGLIGHEFLQAMQPGAFLINTCRAEVVDQGALLEAMESKGLWVGTDVFEDEPGGKEGPFDSPLARHPRCYATHHIGASTDQAERETGAEVVRIVRAFQAGQPIPNCVNLRRTPASNVAVTVRHEDRVGVLAGVFAVLKEQGANVQEMENLVFAGARAAAARILLEEPLSQEALQALSRCDGVIRVQSTG